MKCVSLFRFGSSALLGLLLVQGAAAQALEATHSTPIALANNARYLYVVNPENNSVTVIDVLGDANTKVAEIPVGVGPQRLAILPDDSKIYVTNQRSGTVTVINGATNHPMNTIDVGKEPIGCALSPDGNRLYVANFSSDTVSVINTGNDRLIKTIKGIGPKPRALAVTEDKIYVTLFLAQLRGGAPVDELEGADDGKEGRVIVINAHDTRQQSSLALNPLADVGFNSNGSLLDGIPATDPPTFTFPTGAYPNLLDSIVIKGDRAYLPNTAASPNGPFRFNVNVQSFLSVFDTNADVDSGQTINMNSGVQFEPVGTKLFITNPIAIEFKHHSGEGLVVSAATDRLVRVELDGSGKPTINAPLMAGDPGGIVRVEVGVDPPGVFLNSNPRGLVINAADTRAYVFNFITRDVSVVDISGAPATWREMDRVPSADLPAPDSLEATIHRGQELFNTAIGPPGTVEESMPPAGRMSNFGWGSCYGCHPGGLHDGATWMFPDGPRQAISMESTFEHPQQPVNLNTNGAPLLPDFHQRALNWSAVRDEVQDFELNIRAVSGGQGLITDGQPVVNLTPTANTGRSADLDAIASYIAFGIKAPLSPRDQGTEAGRELFISANCQACHGGRNWSSSQVFFAPPPGTAPPTIVNGQLVDFLKLVGTFDPTAANEVKATGTTITTANGELGFNVPSLLSVFAGAPYLHSGAARTLAEVLENVTHRTAGLGVGAVDVLQRAADRDKLVRFLESIDESTEPVPVN